MIGIQLTKVKSKGLIEIPGKTRSEMNLKKGEELAVIWNGDSLLLKRVAKPSVRETLKRWEELNQEGRKQAQKLRIRQKDVNAIIHRARGTIA